MEKSDHVAGAIASDLSTTTPDPEKQQTSGLGAFLVSIHCQRWRALLGLKNAINT